MSSFDPEKQIASIDHKLVASLHKIGEVFKALLLQAGKTHGLSSIQIQILLFVVYHHNPELCTVSHLSQELNLTKPTISDAVRVLFQKGLVEKSINEDTRSYTLLLSVKGKKLVPELENFDAVVLASLATLPDALKAELLKSNLTVLNILEDQGVVKGQRMCLRCKYLEVKGDNYRCKLLDKYLKQHELRFDCPEFDGDK